MAFVANSRRDPDAEFPRHAGKLANNQNPPICCSPRRDICTEAFASENCSGLPFFPQQMLNGRLSLPSKSLFQG